MRDIPAHPPAPFLVAVSFSHHHVPRFLVTVSFSHRHSQLFLTAVLCTVTVFS